MSTLHEIFQDIKEQDSFYIKMKSIMREVFKGKYTLQGDEEYTFIQHLINKGFSNDDLDDILHDRELQNDVYDALLEHTGNRSFHREILSNISNTNLTRGGSKRRRRKTKRRKTKRRKTKKSKKKRRTKRKRR